MLNRILGTKSDKRKNKHLWWTLGLAISLGFGYFAWRDLQWQVIPMMVREADGEWLLTAALVLTISYCLRSIRWRLLLPKSAETGFDVRISGVAIGYFFSNFLPARLGDFIRPAYLSNRTKVRYDISLLSLLGERIWDLSILLLLLLVLTGTGTLRLPAQLQIDPRITVPIVLLGGICLVAAPRILAVLENILSHIGMARVSAYVRQIRHTFGKDRRHSDTAIILGLTIVVFLVEISFFYAMANALNLPVSWSNTMLVMVVTAISFLLPSAPGGIGVYHFFCQTALVAVGVDRQDAVGAAILIHAFLFFYVTVAGLLVVFRDSVRPDRLSGTKTGYRSDGG